MNTAKRETLKKLVSKLYIELGSGDAVMKKLGMARTTVYRLLHEAGVDLPDRNSQELYDKRKTLRDTSKKEAIQDYIDGMEIKDIFEKYHIRSASLYTALKDAGIPRRPHGAQARRFKDKEAEEIVRLYVEEKLSQLHIANKVGSSQPVISRVLREQGVRVEKQASGPNNGSWINGRSTTEGGYVQVKIYSDDPLSVMCNRQGYVLEHRLAMARYLGRPLADYETVHHIDGNHSNNEISNLQLRIGRHGKGQAYQCADCGSHNVIPVELKEDCVAYTT